MNKIDLSELLPGLPDDLGRALKTVTRMAAEAATEQDAEKTHAQLQVFYRNILVVLLNNRGRSPTSGPRGPRLPAGVTFITLLPHLVEANRILATPLAKRKVHFETWAREYPWPAGMKVRPNAVRNWRARYAKLIKAYERQMAILPRAKT